MRDFYSPGEYEPTGRELARDTAFEYGREAFESGLTHADRDEAALDRFPEDELLRRDFCDGWDTEALR